MLFLDTSVFVKVYFRESGSDAVIARFTASGQSLAASVLCYAEMHSAMARKFREGQISSAELSRMRQSFERDWETLVHSVELNRQTMAAIPGLVEQYPLKAGDAIQLSAALWLSKVLSAGIYSGASKGFEFGVSDQILAECARKCGLIVFNPR
jgi:predicted nucleic acid-binding protein